MPLSFQRQAFGNAPLRSVCLAMACVAVSAFWGASLAVAEETDPSVVAGESEVEKAAGGVPGAPEAYEVPETTEPVSRPDTPADSPAGAVAPGLVPGPLARGAAAPQAPSALGKSDSLQAREFELALDHALKENAELRRLVEAAEAQRRILVESLSEAVRVSEEQVVLSRELRMKVEAFGVDLFSGDESGLRDRLLKAVRDLDITRQEEARRAAALQRLSEAFLTYLAATTDIPEAQRSAAEAAIREAGEALVELSTSEGGDAAEIGRPQVVSFDAEIGLVVFESGRRTGLRVGTPVAVMRDDRPIFSAMVVDVRESIAGAVLQERLAENEEVAVGDAVELLPTDAEL